jgi:hypothetical protein
MKRIFLFSHPFLFTLVSVLFFYFGAKLIVHPAEILRPLLVLWCIVLLMTILFYRFTKDWHWAGMLTLVFVFGFFFSRGIFVNVGGILLLEIGLLMVFLKLTRRSFSVTHVSVILSATGFIMVISQVIIVYLLVASVPSSYYEAMDERNGTSVIPLVKPESAPDIYYIVLDGYPRADALEDFFYFDNHPFIEQLEGKGFIVPVQSFSNYPRTALSVSSTLDMQYWDDIAPGIQGVRFWWLTEPIFDNSRLRASLEEIGYRYVSIGVDWGLTDNPTADLYLSPYPNPLTDFENFMISGSPMKILYPLNSIAPVASADIHREYIRYNLRALKDAPQIPGPKFVFSHLILPHPPFVFDENGDPVNIGSGSTFNSPTEADVTRSEYRRLYVDQVRFINDQISGVVEEILQSSTVPPIIILQADHGSAMNVDFMDMENSCLKERYAIFAAYYLPGAEKETVPQDITPVNSFRVVLNEYFSADLNLLENRQYFTAGTNLFELTEVTDLVPRECDLAQ